MHIIIANCNIWLCTDPGKQVHLDWTRRYNIIGGVARGILYLHQDSRLTIIHRDLKASNILLDADMNPKISGFWNGSDIWIRSNPTKHKHNSWYLVSLSLNFSYVIFLFLFLFLFWRLSFCCEFQWLHVSRVCNAWSILNEV